jgi:hypothetical protein
MNLSVGADAYISPSNCYDVTRGDVGIAPYKLMAQHSAVSDVRVTVLMGVSEFTSDNVARVQRHAA